MTMASQHLTVDQHTSTPQLDGYLKGIRDEFDRLKHELDEARKQRDEYLTKYRSKAEELRQLRQTISRACEFTNDNPSPLISPVSSSSEYFPCLEGEDAIPDRPDNPENDQLKGGRDQEDDGVKERDGNEPTTTAGIASLAGTSAKELVYSTWDIEFNSDRHIALNLNLVHRLTHHLKGRTYVAFSMDGKYLATASSLGVVSIFDSKTGKIISVMKDLYEKSESLPGYRCIGFSPDSKYLATGESDGKVRIWIISQRRVRSTFKHRNVVTALNFSPNGVHIATCSHDREVRIWRLRDGFSRVLTFESGPWSVHFSTDGIFVASGCNFPGYLIIWNVRTGKSVANWLGHSNAVAGLVFTPDGNGLLSASWDKSVVHWDVTPLRSLGMADDLRLPSPVSERLRLVGHTDYTNTVSISPDGKWIASGSWDKTVRILNAHDARLHCILHCPGKVWSVNFSPVGSYLAVGGDFDEVTIWNCKDL